MSETWRDLFLRSKVDDPVIGVVGAGAWGTALSALCARAGSETIIWAREHAVVRAINEHRENEDFLPGVPLPDGIHATPMLGDLERADILLLVTPAQHLRTVAGNLDIALGRRRPLVLCAKGMEADSGKHKSEVAADILPNWPLAVLSGPNFAGEVARGLPAAVTIACADEALGRSLVQLFGRDTLRPYWTGDVIGAQIGGVVKNVLAIACGVAHGLDLGANARAALMTRGMAEMMRFGQARGGAADTLMGLSGLGDLILTCGSLTSRNMSFGAALGQGERAQTILSSRMSVAEGVFSAPVLVRQAARLGVDMPIANAVHGMIYEDLGAEEVMKTLLSRPFKPE